MESTIDMYIEYFQSPVGEIEIRASGRGVTHLIFPDSNKHYADQNRHMVRQSSITQECSKQLKAYFSENLTQFTVPLDMSGTPFQQAVWQQLVRIPFGESWSYLDIAQAINNPKAVRAVGAANGKNPVSILVPCHRVIGKNGTLTGYAGEIKRKEWLLEHEKK